MKIITSRRTKFGQVTYPNGICEAKHDEKQLISKLKWYRYAYKNKRWEVGH